ncbi:16S rRNA (cytosine(1402)-N(4))-methyltransferase RsmH [Schlesneria sp. DSM 10557]|uniref:16S rRNA (cytosine(1402)-N(4))-methyltransferase RsmH n=1 Tax=Schlesneria sp. DSM 10557 TaxID=3044399 RepID=UPI0035A039EA
MTADGFERPPRRTRYPGKNPRNFHERYKELQPERYPDEVAHVAARGRTPAGTHRPIMVKEILNLLAPRPGDFAVDCTLGYGGHAQELLQAIQPNGRLLGMDADPLQLPKTEARLRALNCPEESLIVRRMNYAGISQAVLAESPDGADVILADLGLSSMQIDDPDRGFTFKSDGPLDMRLNPQHGQPVSSMLSKLSEKELARILELNADEPQSVRLAGAILDAHAEYPFNTTTDLANVVTEFVRSRRNRSEDDVKQTLRRVFQALRIAVNDEFGALEAFLRQLPACLKPAGRVAILTFHSGEDRRVKHAFRDGLRDGIYSQILEEVMRPSPEEQRANPRSSSAKLRWAVKAS